MGWLAAGRSLYFFWLQAGCVRCRLPASASHGGLGATSISARCLCVCLAALHRLLDHAAPGAPRRARIEPHHARRPARRHDRRQLTAPGIPTLLARIPGNQVLDLHVHEKRLAMPRMPAGRELRIVHLTDLHMSGRIAKEYFVEMVAAVNALEPDLDHAHRRPRRTRSLPGLAARHARPAAGRGGRLLRARQSRSAASITAQLVESSTTWA